MWVERNKSSHHQWAVLEPLQAPLIRPPLPLGHLTQLVALTLPLLGGLLGNHVKVPPLALPFGLLFQGQLCLVVVDQGCHVVAIRLLPLRHEDMFPPPLIVSDLMLLAASEDFYLSFLSLSRFILLQPLQELLQVIFIFNSVFLGKVSMHFSGCVRPLKLVPLPRLFLLSHVKVRTVQIEVIFHQPM